MLAHRMQKYPAYGFTLAIFAVLATTSGCGKSSPQVAPPATPTTGGSTAEPQDQPSTPSASEPTPSVGSSSSDPAPAGSEVGLDDMSMRITEVVAPADDIVRQANASHPTPTPLTHYVMPKISVTCNLAAGSSCSLTDFEFSLLDSAGIVHSPEIFVEGLQGLFESGRFSGGTMKEGYLLFVAPEGDQGLILRYKPVFGSEGFLALQ